MAKAAEDCAVVGIGTPKPWQRNREIVSKRSILRYMLNYAGVVENMAITPLQSLT
jgi:hypothetical protein